MLKRMVVMAALALGIAATNLVAPTTARAQGVQGLDTGGHCLAPGLGDNGAPAQSAGGGAQMSYTRWIAWSFVSTRWMFAGNPVFSQFANFNLGARTPRVW